MNSIDKAKIQELYVKGYSASKIAQILNNEIKVETIKKHIQRNLKMYSAEHEKNLKLKQDCRRAIMNTDKNYMGTRSLIMWNRQSYKTLANGKLVFDESRGLAPADLPKTYSMCI